MDESQTVETAKRRSPVRVAQPIWDTPQWRLLRDALENRRCIVCFDAEWEYQPPNRVTELGVAIQRDGVTTVHNVRVRGKGRQFHGGETIHMTEDAAKAWLRGIMESADLLVGHALQNDRLKMKQWGNPLPSIQKLPMVDTGTWSRIINEESSNPRRLTHLAAQFGVEKKGMHVAGNDAWITLQVAIAMAAVEPESPSPSSWDPLIQK